MNNDLPLGLLPPWASWASEEAYRPANFHTHAGFSLVKNQLHSKPMNVRQQVCMVLGIGLGHKDIMHAVETEPDVPAWGPAWISNSQLSVQHAEALLKDAPPLENLLKR